MNTYLEKILKSKAHLLFLTKFISYKNLKYYRKNDKWEDVLGEKKIDVLKKYYKLGLIHKADIETHIDYKYKLSDLKIILKEFNLPVSGKKEILIKRLLDGFKNEMEKRVSDITLIECTPKGKKLLEDLK